MDEFAKLIDGRINLKTKGQFMKTVPAVVTIGGTDTATVNILSENTTCELLNMTGTKLSVGDQVQVYSCGKTMYIGASRNIVESGATYTAGNNINISSGNVISSHLLMYGNDNVRLSGDATNGWVISWGGYATDTPPPANCTGFVAKFGIVIHYNDANVYNDARVDKIRYVDLVFVSRKYNGVFSVAYCDIPPITYTIWVASNNWYSYEYYGVTATLNMTTSGDVTITIPPICSKQTNTTGDVSSYGIATDVTLTLRKPNSIVYFN